MVPDSENANANVQANTTESPIGFSKGNSGGRKVDLSDLTPEEAAKRVGQ
jgi:hypothetical protein